jgi:hypothetical protein
MLSLPAVRIMVRVITGHAAIGSMGARMVLFLWPPILRPTPKNAARRPPSSISTLGCPARADVGAIVDSYYEASRKCEERDESD